MYDTNEDFESQLNYYESELMNTYNDSENSSDKLSNSQGSSQSSKRKLLTKEEKEIAKIERLKKKEEKLLEKELKKLKRDELKQMKPRECLKNITVGLDSSLEHTKYGGDLMLALNDNDNEYKLGIHQIPYSIYWFRNTMDNGNIEEKDLMIIWMWDYVSDMICTSTLTERLRQVASDHATKVITLVIYEVEQYFKHQKKMTNRKFKNMVKEDDNTGQYQANAPSFLTRGDLEVAMVELQIHLGINHYFVENAQELGNLVIQFTKAIAERPFKLDVANKNESTDWYAIGDSRDCVRIDNDGNGLLRLWQQQLCQFTLVGLDAAQSITSCYPSPLSLVNAYSQCATEKEKELLLQNILIRRGNGPLSSSRKLGPELSKKVYLLFNCLEGNTPLSQES